MSNPFARGAVGALLTLGTNVNLSTVGWLHSRSEAIERYLTKIKKTRSDYKEAVNLFRQVDINIDEVKEAGRLLRMVYIGNNYELSCRAYYYREADGVHVLLWYPNIWNWPHYFNIEMDNPSLKAAQSIAFGAIFGGLINVDNVRIRLSLYPYRKPAGFSKLLFLLDHVRELLPHEATS